MSAGRKQRGGVAFQVVAGGRGLHPAPAVPNDTITARGIAMGIALGLPLWWGVWIAIQWARATGLMR